MGAEERIDLLLFIAGPPKVRQSTLRQPSPSSRREVRIDSQKISTSLAGSSIFRFWNLMKQRGRFVAVHHPFTAPKDEDIPKLKDHPEL